MPRTRHRPTRTYFSLTNQLRTNNHKALKRAERKLKEQRASQARSQKRKRGQGMSAMELIALEQQLGTQFYHLSDGRLRGDGNTSGPNWRDNYNASK